MAMANKGIFNVFFREKPAMMLIELNRVRKENAKEEVKGAKVEVYASSIAKTVDCTYSHVVKILQEMQKAGLVNLEKQGRLKLVTLTKTGQEVADKVESIRAIL